MTDVSSLNRSPTAMSPAKLLIIDQSLRNADGHHFEYDHALAVAAEDLGIDVAVAGRRVCDPEIASAFTRFLPHFSLGWDETQRSGLDSLARRILAALPDGARGPLMEVALKAKTLLPSTGAPSKATQPEFGREVVDLIRKIEIRSESHVLTHTLSVPELQSLIEAATDLTDAPHFHIVLRRDAEEPHVTNGPWGGITGAFQTLHRSPHASRFRFYSDTRHLCQQYEALHLGYPVREIAIPHGLKEEPLASPRTPKDPVRFVYLGNARTEKGFQFIADAVDRLSKTHLETGRARFVLQANANMSLEECAIRRARRRLGTYPARFVELLLNPLTASEFQHHLMLSDVVLLPYVAEPYRRRSSGILVQAMVSGKPVIVPNRTWLSDEATPGAAVVFDDPGLLHLAIEDAVERIDDLEAAAQRGAPGWRQRHNGRALLQTLFSPDADQQAHASAPASEGAERHE